MGSSFQVAQTIKAQKNVQFSIPSTFHGQLYPFQFVGTAFALLMRRSLIADGAGLGKTVQSLAFLACLENLGRLNHALILAPSVAVRQWVSEASRFTDFDLIAVAGNQQYRNYLLNRRHQFYIMSHELFVRNPKAFDAIPLNALVLDEAAIIRHRETKTARAVKRLTKNIPFVLELSATPIQTSPIDSYSMLEALHVELPDYQDFIDRHVRQHLVEVYSGGRIVRYWKVDGYDHVDEILQMFAPYYIRRTLTDVEAQLPILTSQVLWMAPSNKALGDYRKLARSFGNNGISLHTLQQYLDAVIKVPKALELLREDLAGVKVVVFAWYLDTVRRLSAGLREAMIEHVVVTGLTQDKDAAIQRFWTDDECDVLIGDACIERALNLQCASYLLCVDTFTNPTRHDQLVGRLRRIGSLHDRVIAISLMVAGTHEERFHDLAMERRAMSQYIMQDAPRYDDLFPPLELDDLKRILNV